MSFIADWRCRSRAAGGSVVTGDSGNSGRGPAGIDLERVTGWFTENVDGVRPPLRFDLITGGRSNLTYRVDDSAGRRFVLRRPPTGNVLSTAHDVVREWRIIDHLADSPVPVAPVVGCCTDHTVTGADFYVMEFVDGVVLTDDQTLAQVPRERRVAASEDFVDTLVAIHAVSTETGPLAEFRRPGSYLERQLRRWSRQLEAGKVGPGPIWEVCELLSRDIPEQKWTGIVHGDYRPGNLLTGSDGKVQAVLDWELWTVGDVLADLGWLAASWASAEVLGWSPDPAEGFLDVKAAVDRYATRTGRDLSDMRYYHAFALWRLAAINEGVIARFRAGAMGEQEVDTEYMAQRTAWLCETARGVLAGQGPF
ncbi:MAG: phosphotransferase family protein [Nocardia sp.]|nr:phosphotransferase family protein [Nocardia sp.]